MSALLYHNADGTTRFVTRVERDESGLLIFSRQDCRAVVEECKRRAALFDKHAKRQWDHVAEVPLIVWMRWAAQGITRDSTALKKALSRRDARFFRVDDGRRLA